MPQLKFVLIWHILIFLIQNSICLNCFTSICSSSLNESSSSCTLITNGCSGEYCFLEYSFDPQSSTSTFHRGCLNRQYLPSNGCHNLRKNEEKIFCQCQTENCNQDLQYPLSSISDRNVTCDTGCNVTDSTISCSGATYGSLCAFDPDNRARPSADFGESYLTPFGAFAGWTPHDTVCLRFTFPPFYYVRDVTCYCDGDYCDRRTSPIRAVDPYVLCHGCFLDCHDQGEFCGPPNEICRPTSVCRGHYCVAHSVVDHSTGRLIFLGQYCISSSKMLPEQDNVLNLDSGNMSTEIRVCRSKDLCNFFNYTQLTTDDSIEVPQTSIDTWERFTMLRKAISTLLNTLIS